MWQGHRLCSDHLRQRHRLRVDHFFLLVSCCLFSAHLFNGHLLVFFLHFFHHFVFGVRPFVLKHADHASDRHLLVGVSFFFLLLSCLGHFLLTNLLLDRLRAADAGRVVCTASDAYKFGGRLDFSDLQAESNYSSFRVYGRSKLANILFTQELAERESEQGVTANCFHPGFVASDFSKNNGRWARIMMALGAPFARSPEKGAETGLHLASSQEVQDVSGYHFVNGKPRKVGLSVQRPGDAEELWRVSEELTNFTS